MGVQSSRWLFTDSPDDGGQVFAEHLHAPRFRGRFEWRQDIPEHDELLSGPHDQVLVDVEWIDAQVFGKDELELSLSVECNRWDRIDNP